MLLRRKLPAIEGLAGICSNTGGRVEMSKLSYIAARGIWGGYHWSLCRQLEKRERKEKTERVNKYPQGRSRAINNHFHSPSQSSASAGKVISCRNARNASAKLVRIWVSCPLRRKISSSRGSCKVTPGEPILLLGRFISLVLCRSSGE